MWGLKSCFPVHSSDGCSVCYLPIYSGKNSGNWKICLGIGKEGLKVNNMWTRQDCLENTDLAINSQLVKILDLLPKLMHNWLKFDEISVKKVQPEMTQSLIGNKIIKVRIVFQEEKSISITLGYLTEIKSRNTHYC